MHMIFKAASVAIIAAMPVACAQPGGGPTIFASADDEANLTPAERRLRRDNQIYNETILGGAAQGAVVGALLGAIVGLSSGKLENAAEGALIGAAAGGLTGLSDIKRVKFLVQVEGQIMIAEAGVDIGQLAGGIHHMICLIVEYGQLQRLFAGRTPRFQFALPRQNIAQGVQVVNLRRRARVAGRILPLRQKFTGF